MLSKLCAEIPSSIKSSSSRQISFLPSFEIVLPTPPTIASIPLPSKNPNLKSTAYSYLPNPTNPASSTSAKSNSKKTKNSTNVSSANPPFTSTATLPASQTGKPSSSIPTATPSKPNYTPIDRSSMANKSTAFFSTKSETSNRFRFQSPHSF